MAENALPAAPVRQILPFLALGFRFARQLAPCQNRVKRHDSATKSRFNASNPPPFLPNNRSRPAVKRTLPHAQKQVLRRSDHCLHRDRQAAWRLIVVKPVKKTLARRRYLDGYLASIRSGRRANGVPIRQIRTGFQNEILSIGGPGKADVGGGRQNRQRGCCHPAAAFTTGMVLAAAGGAAGDLWISIGVVSYNVPLNAVCHTPNP